MLKGFLLPPDETKCEEMVDVFETRPVDKKKHDQIKPIGRLQLTKIYQSLQYYINSQKLGQKSFLVLFMDLIRAQN